MPNNPLNAIIILELVVNNHPGVMSHVCSLFSRRAYNLEAIACVPIGDGDTSKIWLQVDELERLDQVIKQIQKLPDVLEVKRHDGEHKVFSGLHDYV
ncbi:acetolactate synthase small subunit [Desulfopila sp. IMCC35008]|uniref:acetolactate synthase small subunit n=1 Tax=Desulfopila sp. IMCC35008 TaxID=2653858 RepID=UPI0013CFFF27|nr:acetolactate synthase small subunit [Desulfopila sp. IMCC35008]